MKRFSIYVLLSIAALTIAAIPATAQLIDNRDGTLKFRGAYRLNDAATYQRHAYDYNQMIYSNQQLQPAPQPAVVEQQTVAVKDNLKKSDEELKAIKKAHASDPQVTKLVDSILKHHAQSVSHCNMLMECCKRGDDSKKIGDCCVDINHELEAAKKEMDALRKHLKVKEPAIPAKK